jgi:hypothetical protein
LQNTAPNTSVEQDFHATVPAMRSSTRSWPTSRLA